MHRFCLGLLVTLFPGVLTPGAPAKTEVRFAKVFSDSLVLQREKPATIWGWSSPEEAVTVSFGDQKKRATADTAGAWAVTLDAMEASFEGRTLVAEARAEREASNKAFVEKQNRFRDERRLLERIAALRKLGYTVKVDGTTITVAK